MLKFLRNRKTAKKIWIALALIIMPAFVLWGSGSVVRSQKNSGSVGKINGRAISAEKFKESLEAVRNMAIMQFGENYNQMKEYLALESQAWDRLILLEEARRRGIRASNQEVVEAIANIPYFARKGVFDERQYNEMLQYVFRTQPRIFEEQTRQSIVLSKLFKAVTGAITLSDDEARKEYIRLNEQYSVDYIGAIPADLSKDIVVDTQALKTYYTQNLVQFKQPTSYNLEYIALENPDSLQEIGDALNKRADFAQIARSLGLTVNETGFFLQNEPIPGIGWIPEAINAISRGTIGQITTAFKYDKKFYIFRIKDRKEPFIPEFAQATEKVKQAYINEEAEKIARQKIKDCRQDLAARATAGEEIDLARAATAFGLKSGSTDIFKFGGTIEKLGASDPFWAAASKLKGTDISDILTVPTGSYIVKVKKHIPIDEDTYEKEKTGFGQKALNLKKEDAFGKYIDDLRKRSQS